MMFNFQNAHRLRSRNGVLSGVALAAASMMMLTGCSGSGIGGGPQIYQDSASAWDYIAIDGDQVTFVSPTSENLVETVDALDSGNVDPMAEYVDDTGTLNEARDTVVWADGDTDAIRIEDDMVMIEDTAYFDYDSDRSKQVRETELAESLASN